jgi:hypothetical protein
VFLNEKTAYKCIDYANQAIKTYSTNSTLCMNLESRASLKLNVGKMLRFLRHNQAIKIAFDTIAVYLTAVFEKLLILYVQKVDKSETLQEHKSLFDVFSRFDETSGICIKSRRAFESLLCISSSQPDAWKERWIRNYQLGLRLDENAKQSLFYFVKCPGVDCNCLYKRLVKKNLL